MSFISLEKLKNLQRSLLKVKTCKCHNFFIKYQYGRRYLYLLHNVTYMILVLCDESF